MSIIVSRLMCAVVILLYLTGCQDSPTISKQLRDYYIDQSDCVGQGMIYHYESTDPTMPPEYWHFRYSPGYRGNYLYATLYTPSKDIVQNTKERFSRDKSTLLSMELYFMDSTLENHMLEVKVNSSDMFAFGSLDSTASITNEIEYIDPSTADSVRVILNRTRNVVGPGEYSYDGRIVPTVTVTTVEILETETEGFTTSSWIGSEIYGLDIGLLYYKKEINANFVLEYELVSRTPFEQFKWDEL